MDRHPDGAPKNSRVFSGVLAVLVTAVLAFLSGAPLIGDPFSQGLSTVSIGSARNALQICGPGVDRAPFFCHGDVDRQIIRSRDKGHCRSITLRGIPNGVLPATSDNAGIAAAKFKAKLDRKVPRSDSSPPRPESFHKHRPPLPCADAHITIFRR